MYKEEKIIIIITILVFALFIFNINNAKSEIKQINDYVIEYVKYENNDFNNMYEMTREVRVPGLLDINEKYYMYRFIDVDGNSYYYLVGYDLDYNFFVRNVINVNILKVNI